jgi:histidine triad (HIT) family protein
VNVTLEQRMSADCLFCRIVAGEIPATTVHADDLVLAIRDVAPRAPTHILLMPRSIASAAGWASTQRCWDGCSPSRRIAKAGDRGPRLRVTTNVGTWGGQSVPHLHLHLMGGRAFDWPPG